MQGGLVNRDGLNDVLEETRKYQTGVLVVESISRLGRNLGMVVKIVDELVDRGWRFVARTDGIDTEQLSWVMLMPVLAAAAEMDNSNRASMVRRGRRAHFQRGLAVGAYPRHHYESIPRDPQKPDGDRIVVRREEYVDQINEYFTRIASGQTIAEANAWANSLPNMLGRDTPWELDDGSRMIRSPRYKGMVSEGRTQRKFVRGTGKRAVVPNENPEDILTKYEERQRFVSDELWQAANDALDHRNPPRTIRHKYPRDPKNRRGGLWPSGVVFCGWCGAKMHRKKGQLGTRYTCCQSYDAAGSCSNYLSAETDEIRRKVVSSVVEQLSELDHIIPALLEMCRHSVSDDHVQQTRQHHEQQLKQEKTKLNRLYDFVEEHEQPDEELRVRIHDHRRKIEELQRQLAPYSADQKITIPSERELRDAIGEITQILEADDVEDMLDWLRMLVPEMVLYPVRIHGCATKLVEARYKINLLSLLPIQWKLLFDGGYDQKLHTEMSQLSSTIKRDIITPLPKYVQVAEQAAVLRQKGITQVAIAKRYDVHAAVIHRGLKIMQHYPDGKIETVKLKPTELPPFGKGQKSN